MINENQKQNLRERCIAFASLLAKQLQQRLPDNVDILLKVEMISPCNVLRQIKDNISPLCEYFALDSQKIEKIEFQWRKINLIIWSETNSAVEFWVELKKFKDAASCNPFEDLANFAFMLLALPFSNAAVERIFSQMNLIKTKTRNRMGSNLLISLLHVRSGLKRNGKCCDQYILPDSIMSKIGTKECYSVTYDVSDDLFDDLPI